MQEDYYIEPVRHVEAQSAIIGGKQDKELIQESLAPISATCECVRWLREVKGVAIRGNADSIQGNVDIPLVGGVVLQSYNGVAHASLIKAILPNGNLYVAESNFKPCLPGNRVIKKDSPNITGYYYKNPNLLHW